MQVLPVAETKVNWDNVETMGYHPFDAGFNDAPDELAEAAGRLCYKSFHRPNPKTSRNEDYLRNIINQKHFSVLEHTSVTFYVSGVTRNLLIELERHRHLSFSVVSQRYVDHSDIYEASRWRYPPLFEEVNVSQGEELKAELEHVVIAAASAYQYIVQTLAESGLPRKQMREAARAVLPGCVTTEFFVTGNLRAWREVLEKRLSPAADAEIRIFAEEVLEYMKLYAPATFQDFQDRGE